ncbi:hypothetical protein [Neobacillus sp. OS1-33]|uniref:rolling circle replication-associated protein n=1 Tax=Neobacillus sp. OS1-33 TaxID=3070683 RepID=UPI0027E1A24B|nr:hypothetical protein [Neobacillus sp. OS1-33]WML26289.1 hypothetical protein RCG22_01185 [Neobacillus sp. OS1-33]
MKIPQYTKAIISNNLVEVTQQSYPPPTGRTCLGGRKHATELSSENYEANVKKSISRAKNQIRRLLECNFTNQYAFVTLTFAPSENVNVTDIEQCNKMFADFKKRLAYHLKKYKLPKFKYLGVTEFQDEKREGAIHYHLVCNLTEVPPKKLQVLWEYGFVHKTIITSNAIENEKLAHYFNKGITDQRLIGHKKYFRSHGLKNPIILEVKNPDDFYQCLEQCEPTLRTGKDYFSHHTGDTIYQQYYVKNTKELMEYVQEL